VILAWFLILASAAWVVFAYAGYPLALMVLARISPRSVRREDISPPISIIIAVHNGERALRQKLDATLGLVYTGEAQIIVASDGSTDDTNEIARAYADRGVELVGCAERNGKESAQAAAIGHATGEILVFTDVTAELEPGALQAILRPFADPSVGCVSSEDSVDSEGGEGAYVRFEMALRRLENEATTLVGLSGSFFAIRCELGDPWPHDLASDFRSALEASRRGLRAVSEPDARAKFRASTDTASEWPRKVRTVRRGIAVLSAYRDLLHPRYGRAAFSLWGHKVARFTAPFALLVMLVVSALAAPSSQWAAALLIAQLLGYAIGALAIWTPAISAFTPARLGGFFILVNASMLVAWIHHLRGERAVVWEPTRR
jgi:cellulose synthase/poly-beta-1,6-N-acetylglucosamine synthase-like glycosyltransferase